MEVKVLKEAGFDEALLGLSLSYNSHPSKRVADNLAWKQGGHNKFLESTYAWLDINAPRYWWSQADTYRLSTKQSESTMHTVLRRYLNQEDFEGGIDETFLYLLNNKIQEKDFRWVKKHLPEGFLQRRVWVMNYKCLQNLVAQRLTHDLVEWQVFCEALRVQLEHPEYVFRQRQGK